MGEMWGGGGEGEFNCYYPIKMENGCCEVKGGRGCTIIILLELIGFTLQSPSPHRNSN